MRCAALVVAAGCLFLGAEASAAELIKPPAGADNLEFEFYTGECRDKISISVVNNQGTFVTTNYGCVGDLKIFVWETDEPFDGFNLFGVYEAGSTETIGRKTILIKDAYWTSGNAFAGSVWSDGKQRVVVVPEPGVWVLTIMGFGAVGMSLRRRRATRALATA